MGRFTGVISTDTATICIFDVEAMRHRTNDIGDWWSIPANELAEVQQGNALFLNLGSDGVYDIKIVQVSAVAESELCLRTPSQKLFVGPGEEMSGGGFEPTGEWGGFFVTVHHPYHAVSCSRIDNQLTIFLRPTAPFDNKVGDLVRV